jgi:predicted Zn-dependent peptidase
MKIRTRQAELKNGLRVVAVETPHLSSSYAGLLVNVGSRHEAPSDNGLSHFVEHMVFRGTKSFADVQEINVVAESIGGSLDAATYRDHTLYGTSAHPSKVETAIRLLGEIATSPRFRFIETERRIIKEEMRESFGTRGQMVDIDTLSHAEAYGKHGLAQAIEGTPKLLDRYTVRDLRRHHRRFYTAKNSVLVLAGAVELKRARKTLERIFAGMPSGERIESAAPKARPRKPRFRWVDDAGSQVDLRVSFPGLAAKDPDVPALHVLSRVLAEGLSSRLQAQLIDKRGLAYSLSAGPEFFVDAGSFDFDVMVAPEKIEETLAAILAFARESLRRPPTRTELQDAKDRYRISTDFMRDAPGDLGLWIGRSLLFGVEHDPERAAQAFYSVTREDCARVAKRLFDPATVIVCGVGELPARRKRALSRMVGAT